MYIGVLSSQHTAQRASLRCCMLYVGTHAKLYHVIVAVVVQYLAAVFAILVFKFQSCESFRRKCGLGAVLAVGFFGPILGGDVLFGFLAVHKHFVASSFENSIRGLELFKLVKLSTSQYMFSTKRIR